MMGAFGTITRAEQELTQVAGGSKQDFSRDLQRPNTRGCWRSFIGVELMQALTISEMRDQILVRSVEDKDFRARLIADPKTVISEEFGVFIPEEFNVQVHEDSTTVAHFILPPSSRISEEDLAMIAGGGWLDNAANGGQGGGA